MEDLRWPARGSGRTWDDLGKPAPSLWWQYLRALRSAPPGFATKGKRASTLRAALEQAEQLYQAAAAVDYSARPILAYYGLAQAALAVIQASPRLKSSDTVPSSHGMHWIQNGDGLGTVVPDMAPNGLITLAANATGSGGIGTDATVERLWSALPEVGRDLATGLDMALRPWSISVPNERSGEMHISVYDGTLLQRDFTATLAALLRARPYLAEFRLTHGRDGKNWHTVNDSGGFTIYFRDIEIELIKRLLMVEGTHYYDTRSLRLYADLDGRKSVHPLIIWLSILFALSMIARYHPEQWVRLLDIDSSEHAPMLEDILQRANVVCPGLVLNTLDHMGVLYRAGVRP